MEEDIKILENKLKNIKENIFFEYTWTTKDLEILTNLVSEYRNLIARYKELEKLAEGIEKIRDLTIPAKTDFIIVMRENYLPYIKNDFIPKSKVKEKIKELENEKDKYFEKQVIQGRIELLQELLSDFSETGDHIPRID